MSPQMRRYLPLILIGFLAIFILPQLFNRQSSGTRLSESERGALTLEAANRIGRGQAALLAANGEYTPNLSDLAARDKRLAETLTVPLAVSLDVGRGGKSYLVRVSSDAMSLARSVVNGKLTSSSCRELKSKAECPEATAPATTSD